MKGYIHEVIIFHQYDVHEVHWIRKTKRCGRPKMLDIMFDLV